MLLTPALEFAFAVRAEVEPALEVGRTHSGLRRIVAIKGGTFEGENMKGRILPGGADWQLIHDDGVTELDARYTLQTDSGELIYVHNSGLRCAPVQVLERLNAGEIVDPSLYYFRTVPTFETASAKFAWLTWSIFIGSGERYPSEVHIRFWRVL